MACRPTPQQISRTWLYEGNGRCRTRNATSASVCSGGKLKRKVSNQAREYTFAVTKSALVNLKRQAVRVAEECELLAGDFVDAHRLDLRSPPLQFFHGFLDARHLESQVPQTSRFGPAHSFGWVREGEQF